MSRILRHLLMPRWWLRRSFPETSLRAIEEAIRAAERTHGGEIRFAIETSLDLRRLVAGETARARALAVFSKLRVWDTERNNGVLIYLLLADRDIEIVADRGLAGSVGQADWDEVCRIMEAELRAGRFEAGALAGVQLVAAAIRRHHPPQPGDRNELPDTPAVLD